MIAPVLRQVGEPLVLEEVTLDDPKVGEVQVRMAASGVCHSCLHAADGSWGATETPMMLGDEGAGVIAKIGPGVTRSKVGDHVILTWAPTCGQCHYCVIGRPVLCLNQPPFGRMHDGTVRMHLRDGRDVYHYGPATYAPEIVVPETWVVKIRDDVPLDRAALIGCSVMTGVGAVINTAQVPPGASLVVFGCGGVGLNAIQGGRLVSAHPLIAVDVIDAKLEFARGLGATHAINGAREDVPTIVKQLTGRGADYAVVAVGSTKAYQQAWDSLAPGGTCVVVGLPPLGQPIAIDPFTMVGYGNERRLLGSRYGSARVLEDFPRMVELYRAGKLQIDQLITKRYGVDEINEAHRALAAGENARGIIVF